MRGEMWDGFRTLRSDLSLYSGLVQATGGGGSPMSTILHRSISLFTSIYRHF